VLSIGKLTSGADSARYYEQSVATGREDYYSGRGEADGEWVGAGAEALGLHGPITEGELEALLVEARHPRTGDSLRAVGGTSVQGFDLTFSAPKSVSVILAAGDENARAAVVRAHERAVRDALGYVEREAVQVRRGTGGAIKEHAGGLVAGAYRHRTSRAGDPQLHTHVVAANLAQGADRRWTALHGAQLYTHAKTAGYLYQAALREQLTRELGVEWGTVHNGTAEIRGMPFEVLEHFSQRRAEIVQAMTDRGTTSAGAAQIAALQTRRAKDYAVDGSTIYEKWQARAAEHGLTKERLAEVLGHEIVPFGDEQIRAAVEFMSGEAGLTAQASTFTRREALQALAELHPSGASVARIEELTDRWLASGLVVRVDGEPAPIGRHQVIATRTGARVANIEDRFSTPGMLATERQLVDSAGARVGEGTAVATPSAVDEALGTRSYLAEEQRELVRALTTSGDGVQIVLAKAGAGKTTAMDAAREAWQRSGITVQGTALGSYATKELRDSGVSSTTVARLLTEVQQHGLPHGSVLIVDEAGMVGTRTIALLADHARRYGAKLVLVGDDKQLPEIDAGGAFRGLAVRLAAVELRENRRQQDPEDRRILDAHRAGHPDELIQSLRRRGRIAVSPDVEQTRHALVSDWWQGAQVEGLENVAMIALRRSEVRELNRLARAEMRAGGRLGDHELRMEDRAFAAGDRIVTRTNAPKLGVVNGSRGTVTAIGEDHSIAVQLDGGEPVVLPETYVTGRRDVTPNLDHGYAITAHGIQGGTVDRSYILASEETYQEWGYVAASRHRVETRFYITVPDPPADEQRRLDLGADDPLDGLVRALGHSRVKDLAIDVAAAGELRVMVNDRLLSEAAHLREVLAAAPSGAHEVERLDRAVSEARRGLARATAELTIAQQQMDAAPRRQRRTLQMARARCQRAAVLWSGRVDALTGERAALITYHGDPDAWLVDHHEDAARLAAVERELTRRSAIRRQVALRMVVVDPPAYVTDELGKRPTDDLNRQTMWDRGARAIESYRQRHGATIEPGVRGLGQMPSDPRARGAHLAATRQLDVTRIELGHRDAPTVDVSRGPEMW
jgi:conjugative relaxase-like TrwC/TraI family protein